MHTTIRREHCSAKSDTARSFGAAAAIFGLAAALCGCQTATVTPSTAGSEAQPTPSRTPAEQVRTESTATNAPVESGLRPEQPAALAGSAQADLIGRIRDGLILPPVEDPAVDRELDWYVSNADYVNQVLHRSERYLHYIVEALQQRDMPLDLALLPIVESAFDPFAYSQGQAAGLWQIIPGTGRELGLKQNWWYDARRDVLESTRGALDYLQMLHDLFDGDWLLAVAGYNAGGGSVTRAIRQAETAGAPADFWGIRRYLPVETRRYVPRLLALGRLVGTPSRYDVSLPAIVDAPYFDVVDIGGQIDMALAAEIVGVTTDQLYLLNPGVNRWATDPDGPHRLLVPVAQAERFAAAVADPGNRQQVRWTQHRVRAGDTLGHLASTYRTTTAVLREVNGLRGDMIRIGQDLMIPHAARDPNAYTLGVDARTARTQDQPREGRRQAYVVRAGDSLWGVARRYGVEVGELAQWNAMAPGDVLRIGQELVVWSDAVVFATDSNERIRRVLYTVRKGDSLYRISTRFRVSVAELRQWNDLSTDRYLQPGQQLIVYVNVTEQSTS